jgi:hypothetical protein
MKSISRIFFHATSPPQAFNHRLNMSLTEYSRPGIFLFPESDAEQTGLHNKHSNRKHCTAVVTKPAAVNLRVVMQDVSAFPLPPPRQRCLYPFTQGIHTIPFQKSRPAKHCKAPAKQMILPLIIPCGLIFSKTSCLPLRGLRIHRKDST